MSHPIETKQIVRILVLKLIRVDLLQLSLVFDVFRDYF